MALVDQKQLQKRATNPFVKSWSGGLKLVGVDAYGYNADLIVTFSATVAAGGNSVTLDITSGNAAQFELLKFKVADANGKQVMGVYSGAPVVLDTSALDKAYNNNMPLSIGIVSKEAAGSSLSDNNRVLSYEVQVSAGAFVAGTSFDTADRLNSDDNGLQILDLAAAYTTGPDQVAISAKAIAAIGLAFEVFENGVSIGTGTVSATGAISLVDAGTRAAGSYTYKVEITTAGAADGSFAEVTITV